MFNLKDNTKTYTQGEVVNIISSASRHAKAEVYKKIFDLIPAEKEGIYVRNDGESISAIYPPLNREDTPSSKRIFFNAELKDEEDRELIYQASGKLNVGWYQNQEAELFFYEGWNHWKNTDLKTNTNLTVCALKGELEYIG